jgi:excisionase family DNA binding protein
MAALVTTPEAARMLDVGPTTIKRWVDQGRLTCITTPGGHRRFELRELQRFRQAMGGQPDDVTFRCLEELLHGGGSYGLQSLMIELRGRLGSWWRAADHLGVVLTELGRQWEAGSCSVAQEHCATHRFLEALGTCMGALPSPPSGPRCMLATAEGEDHTLGLSLAELCVREAGWASLWLGGATPTAILVEAIDEHRPEMVAVSASAWSSDGAALQQHCESIAIACRRAGARLVLGGRGAWPVSPAYGARVHDFAAFVPQLVVPLI